MLARPFSFLLLLLGLSTGIEYDIDPSRCEKETTCFVRDSCFGGTSDVLIEYVKDDGTNQLKPDCDVFLQIKPFTPLKYQLMLRVTSDKPIKDNKITLEQGTDKFVCEKDKPPVGEPAIKFTVVPYGESKPYANGVFCSFTVEDAETVIPKESVSELFNNDNNFPTIVFETDSLQSFPSSLNYDSLWTLPIPKKKCDPDEVVSVAGSAEDAQLYQVDTTQMELKCSPEQVLRIDVGGAVTDYEDTIKCDGRKFRDQGILAPGFKANCALKFCSLCKPYEFDNTCPGCDTKPTEKKEKSCLIMECKANKWSKEGGVVDGKVECKKDSAKPTEGAWYMGADKASKMGCSDKFDCALFSKLTLDGINPDAKNLSCADSSLVIRISETVVAPSVICDDASGLYKHGDAAVPKGVKLSCEKPAPPSEHQVEEKKGASKGALYGAIGGTLAVILLVGGIAAVFIMRKRRAEAEAPPPKSIKKNLTKEAIKSKEAPSSGAPSSAPPSGGAPSSTDSKK